MDEADNIWNRACAMTPASERAGDVALNAALRVHSMVMSGGVLHAVETLDATDLDGGEAGFTWLGLADVATVVRDVRQHVEAGALDDDEQAEALESDADDRYSQLIPTDAALEDAFLERLSADPDSFMRD